MNIPTLLTIARMVIIPFFVCVFYFETHWSHWVAAGLFILAAMTDWLDGYLARRLLQSTQFGAFLDPVADKLLVMTALVMIVGEFHLKWLAIPAAIMIMREVAVSSLREWLARLNRGAICPSSWIAKCKTATQLVAIVCLLIVNPGQLGPLFWFGAVLLYGSTAMAIISMIGYVKAASMHLTFDE